MTSPASFNDSSGFVCEVGVKLFRRINKVYLPQGRKLIDPGLYYQLSHNGSPFEHELPEHILNESGNAVPTIQPRSIPFINYPYEWSFDQLKDPTLYNGHFLQRKPVFIDTLSSNIQFTKQKK